MLKKLTLLLLCINSFLVSASEDITEKFFAETNTQLCPDLRHFETKVTCYACSPNREILTLISSKGRVAKIEIETDRPTEDSTYNYIHELKVNREYQGKKIGSLLLQLALSLCKGKCVETRLAAVPKSFKAEDYQKLKRFYTANGGTLVEGSEIGTIAGNFVFQRR